MNNFLKKILYIATFLLIVFGYSTFQRSLISPPVASVSNISDSIQLQSIPEFQFITLDKTSFTNSNLDNIPTIIHFWGTWCAPCKQEFPDFISWLKGVPNQKYNILLVAVNDSKRTVLKFLKDFNLDSVNNVKLLIDETGKNMNKFGSNKVPETFLFSPNGLLIKHFVGPQPWLDSTFSIQNKSIFQ